MLNINNVAMAAAFSLVINCYFCLYKKWNISILLALPSILVVFASGTRKAVFMIIAGLFYFSNSETDIEKQECLGLMLRVVMAIFAMILFFCSYLSFGSSSRYYGTYGGIDCLIYRRGCD